MIKRFIKRIGFLAFAAAAACAVSFCSYAQSSPSNVGEAYGMTVYPGQTVLFNSMLSCGSEDRSWSASSALKIRYGVDSPGALQSKIDNTKYFNDGYASTLGGSTVYGSTGSGSWSEDGFKTYYQVGKIDNKGINTYGTAGSGSMYMAYFADDYDSSSSLRGYEKEGYFDMDAAARFNGINSSSNGLIFWMMSDIRRTTDFNNIAMMRFDVGDSSNVKIYPDSYPDLVYADKNDLAKLCPFYTRYGSSGTAFISTTDANSIYNSYGAGSGYFNAGWVNNYWRTLCGTEHTFLRRDISNSSYLRYPTNWNNFRISGTLTDNIETDLYPEVHYKTGKYAESYLDIGSALTSTFQLSKDGVTWVNLCSGVSSKSFEFSMVDHSFTIGGTTYAMPPALADANSWYIRRISSATGALAAYNNVASPAMRIRPALSLDGLDLKYVGAGVTEGGYMDPADVRVVAHYSTGDVVYPGSSSFIVYSNTRIMNVGKNNYVYYTYTDPKLKEVRKGYFLVQGMERKPVSISAVYEGQEVVIGKSYNPSSLRVTVTYNNGDIGTFTGASTVVGTLNGASYYGVGDCDLTGAVNKADLTRMQEEIKSGSPFSSDMRAFSQADINGDGAVDDSDAASLKNRIDGKVSRIGSNTFYATYSGLEDPAVPGKPLLAVFYVTGINRKPYKISVVQEPDKKSYIEGEDFDPKGMILAITYDNEEVRYINFDGTEDRSGLKIGDDEHPATVMPAGQTVLPIKYTENETSVSTLLRLTVRNKNLTSIRITQPPDTLVYYAGENFNAKGMIVTAFYDEDIEGGSRLQKSVLDTTEYSLSDNRKLKSGTEYVVIKADTVDSLDTDLAAMNGYLHIAKSDIVSGPGLERGDSGTWHYNRGGTEKSISGQIVGNRLVKVSFTERLITKSDYQPITVYPRKLSSLSVSSVPFTTGYMTGDEFDPAGLILRAGYTDGTSDYVYIKSGERNGYEIINGGSLTADMTSVTARYTENEVSKDVVIPITVVDPSIDGIEASYTGDSVYVGTDFDLKDVIVVVSYNNGNKESFRANELNGSGTLKAKIVKPLGDGTIDATAPQDTGVTSSGANFFAACYSGHAAVFAVPGIAPPDSLDFSGSVAENKRDYATWTEEFTAVKIKTAEDFIRGNADAIGTGSDAEENHLVEAPKTTDTRTSLIQDEGTMAPASGALVSPLLKFLRQGTWVHPETVISVQYKGRTDGYLFPEVTSSAFGGELSYITKYFQNRAAIAAADNTDGWSDWVGNGDSVGTVLSDRIAYNYSGTGSDASSVQMNLGRLKFRLRGVPDGSDAALSVEAESVTGTVATYTFGADDEPVPTVFNPARLKITLTGNVPVRNASGGIDTVPFSDAYKVYYRATTDNAAKWAKAGEWTGYTGVPVQSFELRLMQAESFFDEGSASDRPVITENPRNQTAVIGYSATLTVKAVGNDLSYQWYKNGEAISGASTNTYTTPVLSKADDGNTYYCRVSGATSYINSAVAMINVKDEMPAITQNISNIEGAVGDSQTLTVQAYCRSVSDLTFGWEITDANGEYQPFTAGSKTESEGVSTIGFSLTSAMHGRRIRCKVSNSIGSVYSNAIQVNCSMDPVVELSVVDSHVTASKSAITVTAFVKASSAGGIKTWTWTVNGAVQPDADGEKMKFVPAKEGVYEVTCKAQDDFGACVETISIYAGRVPSVTLSYEKTDSASYPGKKLVTVTATVNASAVNNEVSLSWSRDGSALSDNGSDVRISGDEKTLILDNVEGSAQFTVTCRVTDRYGDAGRIVAVS